MPLQSLPRIQVSACTRRQCQLSVAYRCSLRHRIGLPLALALPPTSGVTSGSKAEYVPFQAAAERLRETLEVASWKDEDEAIRHELGTYSAEMKLHLFTNLGSIVALVSFLVSWITGEDPLGGFSMNGYSLHAALVGAGYAAPLVLFSLACRLQPVRLSYDVLDDLQDNQQAIVRPIVADLNTSQLLILASAIAIPSMLLLLPAFHGAATLAGSLLAEDVLAPLGLRPHLPGGVRQLASTVLPAVLSAYFAAWVVARQVDVNPAQLSAIREAVQNAERYFLHAAAQRAADRPELMSASVSMPMDASSAASSGSATSQPPRGSAGSRPGAGGPSQQGAGLGPVTVLASTGSVAGAEEVGGAVAAEGDGTALRQLSAEMSEAFKRIAVLWLLTRRKAAQLGYVLTALHVSYLGVIWHTTRDLATPVTAALITVLAELVLIKHLPKKSGGGGGSA